MKKSYVFLTLMCFFLLHTAIAQNRLLTGVVITSDDGSTIPGVSVVVKENPTIGTLTDVDGKFQLSVPATAKTLLFTSIGMENQEYPIVASNVINITLVPFATNLDEVVVVGYGTQIKSKVTGNISRVSGEALKNTPVPSIQQAMQGKSAGVFVEGVNGKVGGQTRMRIRGSSSITANNEPLFIIDGIALTTEPLNQSGAPINPLESINFNDIESLDVLKDASATAVYGSRGANGVVLITTKKGKAGATQLNVNFQYGFSKASNKREFMNTDQYISYFREAAPNSNAYEIRINMAEEDKTDWVRHVERRLKRYSGWAGIYEVPGDPASAYLGSAVNTNWQDEAFQKGALQMFDISAAGGTEKLKYYASLAYTKQQAIIVSNGLNRFTGRLNVDNKVNNFIDMGFTVSLSRTDIDQVSADNAFSTPLQSVALSPITPVYDTATGELYNTPTTTYYNPLVDVQYADRNIENTRTVSSAYINFLLAKGLNWRSEFSYDLFNLKENDRYGSQTDAGTGINGYAISNYGQTQNLVTKSYLNYGNTFGDYNLTAVLGGEFQKTDITNTWVDGQNFPTDDLKYLASAGLITSGTSALTEYAFISYFSRLNFDYKSKYLVSLSARIDESSRFGENNKSGFFPAASVGWILTKEDMLKNSKTLSFLKLRASYGLTGNAGIGDYRYLGLYDVNSYNSEPGFVPTQIANPDLGWESTRQVDFGVDYGFFKNRISGEIDYYVKKTDDLLLDVPVPGTSGFSTQIQNIGSVENKGYEFVLNTSNLVGDFKWSTSVNMSLNHNEVTYLGGQQIIDDGSSRYMNVVMVGQPLGVFYGAKYAGVASDFIAGGNPDGSDIYGGDAIWYVNETDDKGNIINPGAITNDFNVANFVVLGHPTPDFLYAFTNTFNYKGFELDFTFQGVGGNNIHLTGDSYMGGNASWYDNQLVSQLESWKNPGDITNVPEARINYGNGDQARSSRYLSDGAYLKLRSLTLGYEFPQSIVSKAKLSRIRIYMQAQNLYTFTKYIGWDPEVSADYIVDNIVSGVDFYSAPQPRSITFGLNIGL
jgi:TonB-dependent starch-binding outer membrane protein SusC